MMKMPNKMTSNDENAKQKTSNNENAEQNDVK